MAVGILQTLNLQLILKKKLLNYTHHYEFEQSGLNIDDLKKKNSRS